MNTPSRNDPCPCGSGRKFKHCCQGQQGSTGSRVVVPKAELLRRATLAYQAGQVEVAEAACHQVLQGQPRQAEAWILWAAIKIQQGSFTEAKQAVDKALQYHYPHPAAAQEIMGRAWWGMGQREQALASFRKAVRLDPSRLECHFNIGGISLLQGDLETAESSFRYVVSRMPQHADAWTSLGVVRRRQGYLQESLLLFQQVIERFPSHTAALHELGKVALAKGDAVLAEQTYRTALANNPDDDIALSSILFAQNFRLDLSPAEKCEAARQLGRHLSDRVHGRMGEAFACWNVDETPVRLRVGLVSGDFRRHPVGYFLENVLPHLHTDSMELIVYSTHDVEDELTRSLKQHAVVWKSLVGLPDREAVKLIYDDGIHILVDLAGHTRHNRLAVFAARPAPVQVSWLGYFATTGLPEMDYVLVDTHVAPVEESGLFTEARCWLPDTYRCFNVPVVDIAVNTLPALTQGQITLGCFNNLSKLNASVLTLWRSILESLPEARLLLKAAQLDRLDERDKFSAYLQELGLDTSRIILQGGAAYADYLQAFHQVDMALDPFPYTGGTVSIEGLWMGVPVLTLSGCDMLSRSGENLLCNLNMQDWIAHSPEDYVARAVRHAKNIDALAQLRATLRTRLEHSALMDGPRFAGHWQAALWQLWLERGQSSVAANNK